MSFQFPHFYQISYLQQVEVSVELRALGVFQSLELSGDEQEDVLETKQKKMKFLHYQRIFPCKESISRNN